MAASKKAVVEKKTGEKYSSKSSKMKHEKKEVEGAKKGKKENLKEMMKEYGAKAAFAKIREKAKSMTKNKQP
jgi:hypothetical protein